MILSIRIFYKSCGGTVKKYIGLNFHTINDFYILVLSEKECFHSGGNIPLARYSHNDKARQ